MPDRAGRVFLAEILLGAGLGLMSQYLDKFWPSAPPWLGTAIFMLGAALVLLGLYQVRRELFDAPQRFWTQMRRIRFRLPWERLDSPVAPQIISPPRIGPMIPAYSLEELTYSVPITHMRIALTKLKDASPWVEFIITVFNGSGDKVQLGSASGRIKVADQMYHHSIELERRISVDRFQNGKILLRVPLNEHAAKHLSEHATPPDQGHLTVRFVDCAIHASRESEPDRAFEIRLPNAPDFDLGNRGNLRHRA